jgi:DNA-binding HxlR family transcriptional regulator
MTSANIARELLDGWQLGNLMASDCPSRRVLSALTSRWGFLVTLALATGPHRFSEVRRRVGGVSERMLSQALKDLEADGFVLRVAYDVVPPHVVYSLTPLGEEAAAHLTALAAWIEGNLPSILKARPKAA